jgi:diguanylate cyclase (GGDEF)-like protein
MRYTGRIVSVLIIVMFVIIVRIYAWFNLVILGSFPIVGSIALFPFWWLGWQYDKAKFYSEKDGLTSCYNRRYIHSIIPKLFKKSDENHTKLSVTIIDVNKFKRINDEFGHDVGDKVLVQIADVLHRICQKGSIVSRWGGDEFMLISSRFGNEAELEQFLGEFKNQLSHGSIPNITCSYGSSFRYTDGQSFEELFNRADERMYRMKLAGPTAYESKSREAK